MWCTIFTFNDLYEHVNGPLDTPFWIRDKQLGSGTSRVFNVYILTTYTRTLRGPWTAPPRQPDNSHVNTYSPVHTRLSGPPFLLKTSWTQSFCELSTPILAFHSYPSSSLSRTSQVET